MPPSQNPTIQAATNKSESFNDFVQWLAFGGSVITENDRAEQRKIIKYNHLLANCLIFHNVCMMTRVLHKLRADGVPVEADTVAALSPYIRSHINRFGQYNLDLNRTPAAIDYDLSILTSLEDSGESAPTITALARSRCGPLPGQRFEFRNASVGCAVGAPGGQGPISRNRRRQSSAMRPA